MTDRYVVEALDAMGRHWIVVDEHMTFESAKKSAEREKVAARILDTKKYDEVIAQFENGRRIQ